MISSNTDHNRQSKLQTFYSYTKTAVSQTTTNHNKMINVWVSAGVLWQWYYFDSKHHPHDKKSNNKKKFAISGIFCDEEIDICN